MTTWMSVSEINAKVLQLAGISLARWPKSKTQPEAFQLGQSGRNLTGTGAKGAYMQTSAFDIKALKIPSRVRGKQ